MASVPPSAVRVLLVEDDPTHRALLTEVCASEGYQVQALDNGHDALMHLGSGKYDLLLIDATMPGMSGYDVLEALRRERAHIPVIMVTADPQESARQRALDLGAFAFVEKPFRLFDVVQHIRQALRRPRTSRDSGTHPALRARRAFGDVLPHLPPPRELRPFLRRALAADTTGRAACVLLSLDSGAELLRTVGRAGRDGALGAMIVQLGARTLGAPHRADEDEVLWLSAPLVLLDAEVLLAELTEAGRDALGDDAPQDLHVSLGIVALSGADRVDPETLILAAREAVRRARAASPRVWFSDANRDPSPASGV